MRETMTLALKLFIITAVSAIVLAFVNDKTKVVIAEREQEEYVESLAEVFPEADEFEDLDEAELKKLQEVDEQILDVAIANKDGNPVGWTVKADGKGGYGGSVQIVVGIDDQKNITGYTVLQSQETPGIGDVIEEDTFISSLLGKSVEGPIVAVDSPSAENEIQAISGATYSVNAVTNGLNAAVTALESID